VKPHKPARGCNQHEVMVYIANHSPCATPDIKKEVKLTTTQINGSIMHLKKRGLVVVDNPDAKKGRCKYRSFYSYAGTQEDIDKALAIIESRKVLTEVNATVKELSKPTLDTLTSMIMTPLYEREDGVIITKTLDGEIWESRRCKSELVPAYRVPLSDGSVCLVPAV
jgi:predicted transcriptional regulator